MRLEGEISIFHAGHQKSLLFASQDRERSCQAAFFTGIIWETGRFSLLMFLEGGWCLLGVVGSGDGIGQSCRALLCPLGIFILSTFWGKFPIHTKEKHQEQGVGTLHPEWRLFTRLHQPQPTWCIAAQIPLSLLEAVLTEPLQMVSAELFPAFGMGWQPAGAAGSSELPVLSRCCFLPWLHRISVH